MSYQSPTGGDGYTCMTCGMWVAWNSWHQCRSYPTPVQPQPVITYYPAWWPAPLTEERVREIVRDEIAAKDAEPQPEPSD